ncbi:hypothetical protein FRC02_007464 [Tulasnella sp. 418]|nr:hypothetical protein FRC02_007464 [Tulasnella sp. 418]
MTAVVTLHHYGRDSNSGREPASAASGLVRAVIERWNTPILSLIPQPDALMNHEQAPSHNHDIQDLEEFGSTDFATLLFFQTEKHRTTKKRKRSHKIDVASIIPPPHFIESPDTSRKPSSGIVELRPHKVLEILNPKCNTILQESHGYCQWLIPVSGNPPGSTKLSSGVLQHPSEPTPDTPVAHDSLGTSKPNLYLDPSPYLSRQQDICQSAHQPGPFAIPSITYPSITTPNSHFVYELSLRHLILVVFWTSYHQSPN